MGSIHAVRMRSIRTKVTGEHRRRSTSRGTKNFTSHDRYFGQVSELSVIQQREDGHMARVSNRDTGDVSPPSSHSLAWEIVFT